MNESLFDYLLEKQRAKTITSLEDKVLKLYLQVYALLQHFEIAVNYCKKDKIQKEVEELRPDWTGYENYHWYTYHYEAFGNALYSYTQVYKSILNLLAKKIDEFPRDGKTYLENFITNNSIDKILIDRHYSVHQYGKWRSDLSSDLALQNWKSAERKVVAPLLRAHKLLKVFDIKIINFINKQLQTIS